MSARPGGLGTGLASPGVLAENKTPLSKMGAASAACWEVGQPWAEAEGRGSPAPWPRSGDVARAPTCAGSCTHDPGGGHARRWQHGQRAFASPACSAVSSCSQCRSQTVFVSRSQRGSQTASASHSQHRSQTAFVSHSQHGSHTASATRSRPLWHGAPGRTAQPCSSGERSLAGLGAMLPGPTPRPGTPEPPSPPRLGGPCPPPPVPRLLSPLPAPDLGVSRPQGPSAPALALLIDRAGGRRAGTPRPWPFISSAVGLHHISRRCTRVPGSRHRAAATCVPAVPTATFPAAPLPHPWGRSPWSPSPPGSGAGAVLPSPRGTRGSGCPTSCPIAPQSLGHCRAPNAIPKVSASHCDETPARRGETHAPSTPRDPMCPRGWTPPARSQRPPQGGSGVLPLSPSCAQHRGATAT